MRGQVFIAAAALALTAFAQPAAAQQYPSYHDEHVTLQQQCQQSRNNRTVGGAVIGGLIGAVLGSNVAGDGHRGDGTALGAVVGAAAGGAIGRSTAKCGEPEGSYDPYYGQQNQYNQNDPYAHDNSGLEGGPYRQSGYEQDCRMGEVITRDPYGREYRENAWMCRGPDGVWRPQ